MIRVGRQRRSVTLSADGKHLMTDVWTSVGVLVGVLLVAVTGWQRLDPVVAVIVGINIRRVPARQDPGFDKRPRIRSLTDAQAGGGSNNSIGSPDGSSRRICLPPIPVCRTPGRST